MIKIFDSYGCKILKNENGLFIAFDSGESSGSQEKVIKISESEAKRAMLNEKEAYKVILELIEGN